MEASTGATVQRVTAAADARSVPRAAETIRVRMKAPVGQSPVDRSATDANAKRDSPDPTVNLKRTSVFLYPASMVRRLLQEPCLI